MHGSLSVMSATIPAMAGYLLIYLSVPSMMFTGFWNLTLFSIRKEDFVYPLPCFHNLYLARLSIHPCWQTWVTPRAPVDIVCKLQQFRRSRSAQTRTVLA